MKAVFAIALVLVVGVVALFAYRAFGGANDVHLADLKTESILSVAPDGATLLSQREDERCKGDSGSGPGIVQEYSARMPEGEIFRFYEQELESAGWTLVTRNDNVPSVTPFGTRIYERQTNKGAIRVEVQSDRDPNSPLAFIKILSPKDHAIFC